MARIIQFLPLPITLRMGLHELNKKKMRLLLTTIALAVAVGSFMGILAVFNGVNDEMSTVLTDINEELRSEINNPYELRAILRANINLSIYAPEYDSQVGLRLYNANNNSNMVLEHGQHPSNTSQILVSNRFILRRNLSLEDILVLRVGGQDQIYSIVGIVPFPSEQIWLNDTEYPFQPRPNAFATTLTKRSDASLVDAVGFDETLAPLLDYQQGESFSADTQGIIISVPLAAEWNANLGDMITLQGAADETTLPIIGIFEPPSEIDTLNVSPYFVGMYWEDLAILEGHEIPDIEDLAIPEIDIASFSFLQLLENFSIDLAMYRALLSAISLLIGLVGGLGLLTTLSLSVIERQREIGVMRSIGATSTTIMAQFVLEGITIGVIAWLIGLPLSYWIADRLLIATGLEFIF